MQTDGYKSAQARLDKLVNNVRQGEGAGLKRSHRSKNKDESHSSSGDDQNRKNRNRLEQDEAKHDDAVRGKKKKLQFNLPDDSDEKEVEHAARKKQSSGPLGYSSSSSSDEDEDAPLLGNDDVDFNPLLAIDKPMRLSFRDQVEREYRYIGRTRVARVAADSSSMPRKIEDEGLYAPKPLDIPEWNIAKLENRLLREDLARKIFFDEDGLLVMEPNPLQEGCHRPFVIGDGDYSTQESRLKSTPVHPTVHAGKDQWFDFKISLRRLKFTDYPALSEEELLCKQVEDMYEEYQRRTTVDLWNFYRKKITVLRGLAKEQKSLFKKADPAEKLALAQKWMRTLAELQEACMLVDVEENEQRMLFKNMYYCWLKIRSWRVSKTKELADRGIYTDEVSKFVGRAGATADEDEKKKAEPQDPENKKKKKKKKIVDEQDEEEEQRKSKKRKKKKNKKSRGDRRGEDSNQEEGGEESEEGMKKAEKKRRKRDKRRAEGQPERGVEMAEMQGGPLPAPPPPPEPSSPAKEDGQEQVGSKKTKKAKKKKTKHKKGRKPKRTEDADEREDRAQEEGPDGEAEPRTEGGANEGEQGEQAPRSLEPSSPSSPKPKGFFSRVFSSKRGLGSPAPVASSPGAGQGKQEGIGRSVVDGEVEGSKAPTVEQQRVQKEKMIQEALAEEATFPTAALYLGYPLIMRVKQTATDQAEEIAAWEKELDKQVKERERAFNLRRWIRFARSKMEKQPVLSASATDDGPVGKSAKLARDKDEWVRRFDRGKQRRIVLDRMRRLRRLPGEPLLEPIMERSLNVTPDDSCVPWERKRRKVIKNSRIFADLYVNGQFVTRTEKMPMLHPEFNVYFQLDSVLSLLSTPRSIVVEVHTARRFGNQLLAEIIVPIPELSAAPSLEKIQFSGPQIDASELKGYSGRYVSGTLEVAAYWDIKEEELENLIELSDARDFLKEFNRRTGKTAQEQVAWRKTVSKFFSRSENLDPNDPRNTAWLEMMRRGVYSTQSAKSFRSTEFQKELLLCQRRYYVASARKKVLQARHDVGDKAVVPLTDKEISAEAYGFITIDRTGDASPEELLNQEKKSELARKREKRKIMAIKHVINNVEEVVQEALLPDFFLSSLFSGKSFLRLLEKRRPLRAKRKNRRSVSAPKSCNLAVQLMFGSNFPYRLNPSDKSREHDYESLNSLIEVTFQSNTKRTSTSEGSEPVWNQLITLPFSPPGDSFAPALLKQLRETIHINVFDKVTSTAQEGGASGLSSREYRWIGGVDIPFATIYLESGVEGSIEVEIPFLFGYKKRDPQFPTTLTIYATLDPSLSVPPDPREMAFRNESSFFAYCQDWRDKVQGLKNCQQRKIQALAGDINGKPQLLCRYIAPATPPDRFQKANDFKRFVSCIPFLEDVHQADDAVQEIWCNSQEFLRLGCGDWEEFAVLLCNFYKWLETTRNAEGYDNYVVLGQARPEGETAFVLRLKRGEQQAQKKLTKKQRKDLEKLEEEEDGYSRRKRLRDKLSAKNHRVIINPVTGKQYDIDADYLFSPLEDVFVVFDSTNVWANVQATPQTINRLRFDFSNKKDWNPLFESNTNTPQFRKFAGSNFTSIQPSKLNYGPPFSLDDVAIRANRIERLVEREFKKWRESKDTHWNYGACQMLRILLETFEAGQQGRFPHDIVENEETVRMLKSAYTRIDGIPLHFNDNNDDKYLSSKLYTNPLLKAVHTTKLHENISANCSFAVAVYIHPYASKISSIWVYIAALVE